MEEGGEGTRAVKKRLRSWRCGGGGGVQKGEKGGVCEGAGVVRKFTMGGRRLGRRSELRGVGGRGSKAKE